MSRRLAPWCLWLFLVGCAGSTPREYPPYYDGWETLPSPLFEDLERARRDAISS